MKINCFLSLLLIAVIVKNENEISCDTFHNSRFAC